MTDVDGEPASRPTELKVSDKYDKCIDLALQRLVYGTLAGAFTGFLFFSKFGGGL